MSTHILAFAVCCCARFVCLHLCCSHNSVHLHNLFHIVFRMDFQSEIYATNLLHLNIPLHIQMKIVPLPFHPVIGG